MSPKTPKSQRHTPTTSGSAGKTKPSAPEIPTPKKRILQQRKAKNKGGRPNQMTPDKVSKLEAAFCNDFTVDEALDYANVARATYYRWLKSNAGFRDRMRRAEQYTLTLAKRTVIGQIKEGDGNLGLRFLERRQPERYRVKIESDAPLPPNVTVVIPGSKAHPRFTPQKKK